MQYTIINVSRKEATDLVQSLIDRSSRDKKAHNILMSLYYDDGKQQVSLDADYAEDINPYISPDMADRVVQECEIMEG